MKFDFPSLTSAEYWGPGLGLQLMAWVASWGTKQKVKGSQQLSTGFYPADRQNRGPLMFSIKVTRLPRKSE